MLPLCPSAHRALPKAPTFPIPISFQASHQQTAPSSPTTVTSYVREGDRCLKNFECRCSKLLLNVEASLYLQNFKLSIIELALITVRLDNEIPSLQHLVKLTPNCHSTQLMFWSSFNSSSVLSHKQTKIYME